MEDARPTGQARHCVSPRTFWKLPASHATHWMDPETFAAVPVPHRVQLDTPYTALLDPGAQGVQ